MSQSVTENLFKHDVDITIPDDIALTVDLSAAPWNRTTVADGWWLQNRTNSAFSARDIYLANCIDKINDDLDVLRGGYLNSLISMNNIIYSANDYWDELPPTITPSNTSKPAPSNTLTYMTIGEETDLGTLGIPQINDRTCIIQGNLTNNSFNQILLSENGLYYRSVSGNNTYSMEGEKIENYDLLETETEFCHILDDSTINSAGYWFLHKETSGKPVWTNINALGDYIDNRVNPDDVYIGWSAGLISDYDTRILTLLPPTDNNINSSIDVTDITYSYGAYFWSSGGWVDCPPLMSRSEIEELIFSGTDLPPYDESNAGQVLTVNSSGDGLEWTDKGGGGGGASIKDFLSLFTAEGTRSLYTNSGGLMQSECSDDHCYYFTSGGNEYRTRNWDTGKPRAVVASYTYTSSIPVLNIDTSIETTLDYVRQAKFGNSGTDNGTGYTYTYPIFIELAPFVFTENGTNLPREWNAHVYIKGAGVFNKRGDETPAAMVDVSVIWTTGTPTLTGILNSNEYDTSKTYFLNEGEYLSTKAYFDSSNQYKAVSNYTPCMITKEIDYHQLIPAGKITATNCTPYLRVCIKGISAISRTNGADELSIILENDTSRDPSFPAAAWRNKVMIEEFTDDRFMDMAYRYVNDLPTRRLSYTNGSQDNLLGVNATNPTLTDNTHVLGA